MPTRPAVHAGVLVFPLARFRVRLFACLFAGALGGVVYVNALHNLFVYDDHRLIVDNVAIQHLFDVRAIVLREIMRPLVNLSYAVDHALWGAKPFGYHLTNVLLHVFNVMLLFQLTLRLLADAQERHPDRPAARSPELVAFSAAVLFAVHPIMTEAVGYASGRSEVLCAAFFLAAFFAARRWMLAGGRGWWLLSAALWAGALGCKEVAAMFPFVVLLYDRMVLSGDTAHKRRRLTRLHLPFIATAVSAGIVRLFVLAAIEHPRETVVRWRFLLVDLDVVRRYLGLIVIPEGQTIFHAVPVTTLHDPRAFAAIGLVAVMVLAAWRLRSTEPAASLGLLWFLLILVPSAVLVMLDRAEPMAEHRVYFAAAGLFIAGGTGVGWLMARASVFGGRVRAALIAVLCVLTLSLSGRTILRNVVWGNAVALWEEARDKAPDHWLPHLLLGEALHESDRHFEAVVEYREALTLRPEEDYTYRKLGLCLIELKELDAAAALFEQLRQRKPHSADASLGLGAVALAQGDPNRARGYFFEAIGNDAKNVTARQSLALLDEDEPANPVEALQMCKEIRALAPDTPGNDECIARNERRLAARSAERR